MRSNRPSLTGVLVAGARALYSAFPSGLRVAPDPHAAALAPLPLALPSYVIERAPWAAAAVHRGLGVATLGLTWHIALRTLAIDDALRDAVSAGARQIVLLGAGLDNRAARLPEAAAARVFEVDHPAMQRYKRERLAVAGLSGDARVLVPIDFEVERLDDVLDRAGFDAAVPAFWIWEGVTPYLTRAAVEATLLALSGRSAPGSRVAITYMRHGDDIGRAVHGLSKALARLVDEPLHARYGRGEMESVLSGFGLGVLSDEADVDFAGRYWRDLSAGHPADIEAFPEWERLVIAERRA